MNLLVAGPGALGRYVPETALRLLLGGLAVLLAAVYLVQVVWCRTQLVIRNLRPWQGGPGA